MGSTVPALPSTVTSCPVCSRVVASPVPTTAGMPYSRATSEAWAARVPPSVTTAAARMKSGVQAGLWLGDQDLTSESREVGRTGNDTDAAGGPAGTGGVAEDGTLGQVVGVA